MSRQVDEQRAKARYRVFLSRLAAIQARNVAMGGRDLPLDSGIAVSREAALNAFLARNPDLRCFRDRLETVNRSQLEFHMNEARWREVVAG